MKKTIAVIFCFLLIAGTTTVTSNHNRAYACEGAGPVTAEIFFQSANRLLTAEFTGKYKHYDDFFEDSLFLEFSVKKELFGKSEANKIYVRVERRAGEGRLSEEYYETSVKNTLAKYDEGVEYLICARYYSAPFHPLNFYQPVTDGILKVDNLEDEIHLWFRYDPDTPYKLLYGENWELLADRQLMYWELPWIESADPLEALTQYVIPILQANETDVSEYRTINAKSFEETEKLSECVVKLRVINVPRHPSDTPDIRNCRVLDVVKGDVDAEKIKVYFAKADKVEKGGEYLVCLTQKGDGEYYIASRYAVKTVREPLPTAVLIIVSSAAVGLLLITSATLVFLKVGRARRRIENTDSDK